MNEAGLVVAGADDELVDATESGERRVEHGLRVLQSVGTALHDGDFAAERADFVRDFRQFLRVAAGDRDLAAQRGEGERGGAAEGAGRAGDDGRLALHVEERKRIAERFGDHGASAISR